MSAAVAGGWGALAGGIFKGLGKSMEIDSQIRELDAAEAMARRNARNARNRREARMGQGCRGRWWC